MRELWKRGGFPYDRLFVRVASSGISRRVRLAAKKFRGSRISAFQATCSVVRAARTGFDFGITPRCFFLMDITISRSSWPKRQRRFMEFDKHGHVIWTPKTLYDLACTNPRLLVNRYLMAGTARAFPDYDRYCDFLDAIAERTGVHPRNLYLRGSCQIGFSIAPRPTVWTAMRGGRNPSDLDLVIVDEAYFTRFGRGEVRWWEDRNPSWRIPFRIE